ncbi:uncharacterized protein LOC120320685 [Drosophila yakuba]|uniref:uncharacterized protein LOC120320685 n=1 Tax=Drosophila yakuba TaxID=7245 RepID=UPI00017DD929|nr:uncharacterized protein LOC120320685 [Drosophila yakuba]
MSTRAASNNREVRETGTGEQPGAIWSRDTDSYLQLLASPLVSRSPSLVQEDPEKVPGVDLSEEETVAEESVTYVSLSSESEEDDGGETVTPVVSLDEDEGGRMAYRSVRRAMQGHGRIRLEDAMPLEDLKDLHEFADARTPRCDSLNGWWWSGRQPPPHPPGTCSHRCHRHHRYRRSHRHRDRSSDRSIVCVLEYTQMLYY